MTSTVSFHLADDDLAARAGQLLELTSMDGPIRLKTRQPSGLLPFLWAEGRQRDVLVARDSISGDIVGIGVRSEKECYLNGSHEVASVGYLSGLRVREDHRRGFVLARGYRFLHDAHRNGNSRFYLTTILDGNLEAATLLTSKRTWLPHYDDWGVILTSLIKPTNKFRTSFSHHIKPLEQNQIDSLLSFLRQHGSKRQFFPVYEPADFLNDRGLLPGLKLKDVLVVWDGNQIIGCAGVWDQSRFKAWDISGYEFPFQSVRGLYNLWARWKNIPIWPAPGTNLHARSVALFCVRGDDTLVSGELWQALESYAAQQEVDILVWSLHEKDPFNTLLTRKPRNILKSRLFLVHWPDDHIEKKLFVRDLVPYIETGAL